MSFLRHLASIATTLGWALWFGGLITLFVAATATFRHSHELGAAANPVIFRSFEPYILIVAGFTFLSATGWRLLNRAGWLTGVLVLVMVSGLAMLYSHYGVTAAMNSLVAAGQSGSAQWRSLHGRSMMLYAGQSMLLLIAGVLLPAAHRAAPKSAREP